MRELNYYYDDDGSLVIRARLPAEEGALVLQALNAAMDARDAEQKEVESDDVTAETSEPPDSFSQRRADGSIRFSRPNGRFIEDHPRLPASGSGEGLLRGYRETGEAIDVTSWIIPGDTLDYGIAIEGLIRERGRESCICNPVR